MTADEKLIPAGSQTVGPFFRIGLDYLIDRAPARAADEARIEILGRVLDRDGPVPDAMLEFWATSTAQTRGQDSYPGGFRRAATDVDGNFAVELARPAAAPLGDGRMQAPHMLVLVFARGLLRHLLTRVYFEDEPGNKADPVLQEIPAERRGTLIAHREDQALNSYRWNVVLQGQEQGQDETVFFAW
jgi:protocatechuate 3,4-dioxygenase, alpha subunit